ncbi:MAG: hypothetical protein WBD36_11545 [Bacteroidota bacterium]
MKTRISHHRLLFLAVLLGCLAGWAQAQFAEDALRFSQFNLNVGARSSGMANTTVGFADDYSALFSNPAGLALLRSHEFTVGFGRVGYGNDVSYLGVTTSSSNNTTSLNNLGLIYAVPTVRGSLTLGAAFGRIADYTSSASFNGFNAANSIVPSMAPATDLYSMSSSDADNFLRDNIPYQLYLADLDTSGRYLLPLVTDSVQQSGSIQEGGGMNAWSIGGGIDIAKNLSVGISLNFLNGTYSYDRQFVESDPGNIYRSSSSKMSDFDQFSYESTIKSELNGFNALFGLVFRKPGLYRLGVSVRTPTVYEISETFSDEGRSQFDPNPSTGIVDRYSIRFENSTRYKVQTPYVLSGGASFQLFDWLVLAGDAEYTDWTEMKFESENSDLLAENRRIKNSIFRETTNLRGGAELTLWDLGLRLRAGAAWIPSPYKNDPKDFDQIYFTTGIGVVLDENTSINSAYSLGSWKTFRDNYYLDNFATPSRTSELVKSSTLNVSLQYRF